MNSDSQPRPLTPVFHRLQVAAERMPVESTVIGVDLEPIRPIRNVKTFKSDITSQECRNNLKNELHGRQVDVVLHDGAANVGGGWDKDAFEQNTLVLHALKLAVEFLRKGGTFVTKVFRSADYNALIYVFEQFFKDVKARKPPASRNESAETFVVCQVGHPRSGGDAMVDRPWVVG